MLDDELKALSELDELRIRARKLAEDGMESLASIEDNDPPGGSDLHPWEKSGWMLETALLVRVQNKKNPGKAKDPLVNRLLGLSLHTDLFTSDAEKVPVLLAARAMQSLIALPRDTMSRATLLCYYRIVREFYVADSPEWNAGGARAGLGGEVTAYVTSECIRAVLMLARSLRRTAESFRRTAEFHRRIQRLGIEGPPEEWKDVECERAALDWHISMDSRWSHLAVKVSLAEPTPKPGSEKSRFDREALVAYFDRLGEELRLAFEEAERAFNVARDEILSERDGEKRKADADAEQHSYDALNRWKRSESAHLLALGVVDEAVKMATEAQKYCRDAKEALTNLDKLADLFDRGAERVRRVLAPAQRYIASVLDHELTAAASQEKPLWDARELVFACGAYGAITRWSKDDQRGDGRHNDERLVRACKLLVEALSEEGMFPKGRPFHSVKEGLRWHTLQFQVCRAFSELLKNVEYPVTPDLVKRMLFPFEDLRVEVVDGAPGRKTIGWHMEDPPIPRRPTVWVSTHAVIALDKMVRMLDKRINQMVLSHFSVKYPHQISLTLDKLIYPDHGRGLLEHHVAGGKQDRSEEESFEPVGITLQRMRAHIVGANLPDPYKPEFSAVFFGPPGTGKTTLLEALAKSSHVPLVEMSPSDIAVLGEQAMEARARATFRALSMLTRVVVIFDEFEPILWNRKNKGGEEREKLDLYKFLTPGMLPKLTRLYSAAKAKKVAYTLVTNHREDLDEAAIRRERFDHHVGIYMPDPVSRAGRLMLECLVHNTAEPLVGEQVERFREHVRKTGGMAPARLGPPWLVSGNGKGSLPSAVKHILDGGDYKQTPVKLPGPSDEEFKTAERTIDPMERELYRWEHALCDAPSAFDDLMKSHRVPEEQAKGPGSSPEP